MQHKVEIYTTPTCKFCLATKELFQENNIEYTEHDVATDMERRQEMLTKSGQGGVPVIFIDGQMVIGFNEPKLRELLGI
ncbi:MAG: glutathione S-transferase N-terminal domain-containing protein [Parcubacteria group bacterium]|nr:glutathione S-transferase N-terminal domain-containing protein [Parcubacteria group bacterium]